MLSFVKDLFAFTTLCGFSAAAFTWMDLAQRFL
jgi:hypothetical protein